MSESWRECELGELASIKYGFTAKASSENIGPKFLRITDIQNGDVNWANVPTCAVSSDDFERHRLRENDIVFARTGATTGKSYRISSLPKAVPASYLIRVRITDEALSARFLELFFKSESYWRQIRSGTTGSAQGGFNASKLSGLAVPVPPVAEQERIVAILDAASAGIETAIANTKENLGNAQELFEGYLNSIFSQRTEAWDEMPLSEVCSITSSLVDPREPQYIDLPHVGAGNMIPKNGKLVDVQTAREEGLKSGKYLFDKTMVLYSKIRPYLEKVARPGFDGLCSADVYPLSPHADRLYRDFLFYMLLSKNFTDYAISGSARAGMPKVNRDHLFKYRAAMPGIDDQKRLASILDEVASESTRLETLYQEKLSALNELKQSLLQKAFSGELTADSTEREIASATA